VCDGEDMTFFFDQDDKYANHKYYHNQYYEDVDDNYMRNIFDNSRFELDNNDLSKNNNTDEIVEGIVRTVTNLKSMNLYSYQLDFIKLCIPTLFKYIFRNRWNKERDKILKTYGFTGIYDEMFFVSPRRMGKTLSLAIFCISVIVNIAKDEMRPFLIAVFATTLDSAKRFIDECEFNWKQIDKKDKYHFSRKAFEINIINKSDPTDKRRIVAFCGSGHVSFSLFYLHV